MAGVPTSTVFRVTGLPADRTELEIQSLLGNAIKALLTQDERQQPEPKIGCVPSCDGSRSSTALVEFPSGIPQFLSRLVDDPLGDWQIELGDEDINFDRHFFGFTQLYPTAADRPVAADIIAITGLDGHAFGSWRGKGNLRRMWLRDFLSKDLPNCRTMIYGYNSKLSSYGSNTIMDYGREFLEGIKRIRYTKELRERPLFFIAHSFGGIILAHCLVKAVQADESDHTTIAALYKATYGILFFGTPHKGLIIDDIKRMVLGGSRKRKRRREELDSIVAEEIEDYYRNDEDQHPRMELLRQIEHNSDLLIYQLADFKNLIRDRKIVSFFEMQQTRRLEHNPRTGSWGRTGPLMTAVDTGSALLDLPDNIEAKVPVNADHSQIVKFGSRSTETYKTALEYLKQFEKDAGKVISARFSPTPTPRKKQPTSTVPFDKDENFVGRQDVLDALESCFLLNNSHIRTVLVGLGGVGKSQIAIECSYRLRARDPLLWVFWVHAGTAERFEQGYKSIATALELPGSNDAKTDTLALVLRWLSNMENGRWLLVIDNADDIDVFRRAPNEGSQPTKDNRRTLPLSSYIPQTATGSVLFTSRDRRAASWLSTGYRSAISIDVMKVDDAEKLLSTKIPEGLSTTPDRIELVKELDYLPLAITQAAAYISAKALRMTVAKYLTLYRQDDMSQSRLLDEDSGDLRRDPSVTNSVIRTWQISFDQIKQTRPEAAKLLSFMAMLDRQDIPEVLLSTQCPTALDLEDDLALLNEFSLITVETGGKSFAMHRLVQLATRKWLEQHKELKTRQGNAIKVLSDSFPSGEYENWRMCDTLLPHAREVLKYDLKSREHLLLRASLLYHMAWNSSRRGLYTVANTEGRESLAIRKGILEDTSTEILDSQHLLALLLKIEGKYDEAEPLCRQTLALQERVLGKEHPDTLLSMNNLAALLDSQGKYDEAEPLYQQTLALQERVLGKEHPDTLLSVNNLAFLLNSQGKYDEAEPLCRQTLALRERVLGKEHPSTLTSMNNLAGLLDSQGKYIDAKQMHEQVLESRKQVLGPEHPDTLESMRWIGSVLEHQGRHDEADEIYQQVAQIEEQSVHHT